MAEDQQRSEQTRPHVVTDGASLKSAFRAATAWMAVHAEEINALNVFPVPDGDTGTNMLLTCQAARDEMEKVGDKIPEVMRAIAHGSLMGARGNSGVILSQILRGMARSIDNKERLTIPDLADALHEGATTAYKGVIKPVEGTILTVIREIAEAASSASKQTDDPATFLDMLVITARESVERTPSLLPALRLAGVVDAGGHGLSILLQGIQQEARGEVALSKKAERADLRRTEAPEQGYGYDIQFIIHGSNLDVETLRDRFASMGESALIVGDEHAVKVHIHAPNPGPILDYGARIGSLSRIIVENMEEQYEQFRSAHKPSDQSSPVPTQSLVAAQSASVADLTGISTVVVATGEGFERLFKSLDTSAIVPGGQTMNPSTQQILAAIESAPTAKVLVLPNNQNIIMTAQAACQISKKEAAVVPTKTIPQGIAALLALNYDADLATNKEAMTQAAMRVRTAEITTAVRASHLDGIDVHKGEIIGLIDDRLVAAGALLDEVVNATIKELCQGDFELLTLYHGNGVQAHEANALAESLRTTYPSIEIEVIEGGQPHYMYIISAE